MHWLGYVSVTEMAINSTINASINKVPFDILYVENILLSIDLLLSRESSINPYAHNFASKMKQLATKLKSAIHDA